MQPSSTPSHAGIELPPLVKTFVDAVNAGDVGKLIGVFLEDAFVNDQLCDHWGMAAIRKWACSDIIGENLSLWPVRVVEHYGSIVLSAHIDGSFDKRGLPDPFVLVFYFTPHEGRIAQLIILRNALDT